MTQLLSFLGAKRHILALLIFCGFTFFVSLGTLGFWDPDETRYAEMAREMLERNDFVVPHLNGLPYLEKPPLYVWLVAASFSLLGVSEFAARLPGALLAILGVFAMYDLGRRMFSPRIGFFGALLLVTSALYAASARIVIIDMLLTVCIILALYCFYRAYGAVEKRARWYLGMYFFCALATLAKGPVGVAIPAFTILCFLALRKELKRLGEMKFIWGSVLFLVVTVPWYYAVSVREPSFLRYFFIEKNIGGFATGKSLHPQPFYMSFPMLLGAFFPWSLFLVPLIPSLWITKPFKRIIEQPSVCFLFCWAVGSFLFFTVSSGKLITYFLPTLPPLAVLTVVGWEGLTSVLTNRWVRRFHLASVVIILASVAIGGVVAFCQEGPAVQVIGDKASIIAIVAAIFVAVYLMALLVLLRGKWAFSAGSVAGLFIVIGLVAIPSLKSKEDVRCPRKIVEQILPRLDKEDMLVCYRTFSQGLIFYAHRRVVLVGKLEDYEQGLSLVPNRKEYALTDEELWQMIHSGRSVFVYLERKRSLPADVRALLTPVAEDSHYVILTNKHFGADVR